MPRGQLSDSCSESHPARWYVRKVAASRAESKQRQKSGCINTYSSLSVCLRTYVCVCVCSTNERMGDKAKVAKSTSRTHARANRPTEDQNYMRNIPPSLSFHSLFSYAAGESETGKSTIHRKCALSLNPNQNKNKAN